MKKWQMAIYKSSRWKNLRYEIYKRDLGLCYFCGKGVLKKFVIHHKIELNDDNYHDENISFNPDNLVLCHNKCHEKHHNRALNNEKQILNKDINLDIDFSERSKKCLKN